MPRRPVTGSDKSRDESAPPKPVALAALNEFQLHPKPLGHLPLVRRVIEDLGIREVFERLLPKDPRARVSDGDCVTLMVLNVLQGRVAPYTMQHWLEQTDWELVLGPDCPPEAFHDARLAACLDHIFDYGTDEVLTEVVTGYLASPDTPREYSVHGDTTSLKIYGALDHRIDEGGPRATHGFSKDHRPDLKQLVYGLSLHGAAGIPLTSNLLDGNTSDHLANRLQIDQLAELLPEEHDVTLVADCKLFDARTIGQLLQQAFHFVTLVPRTHGIRRDLVEQVRAEGLELPELSRQPGTRKASPDRVYRGMSFERKVTVGLTDGVGSNHKREVPLRFLVVESSQLRAKYDASLDDRLASAETAFRKAFARATKKPFGCRDDADAAMRKLLKDRNLKLLDATIEIEPKSETLPRPQRGRPRKGEEAPTREVFELVLGEIVRKDEAIEKDRFHRSHFVLATDHVDASSWSDERVLAEYRHQHVIEGHTGFRWLKNVATVAPVFLETPRRVAALALVFILALMVRNYIQFTLRRRLVETESSVLDRKKNPTRNPTTETAMLGFAGVMGLRVDAHGQVVRQVHGLDAHCLTVLEMLRIPVDVFTTPTGKCRSTGPPTSGI